MKTLLLASTVLAGAFALPAAAAECDVTVGVVMELTGPAGAYGQAGAKSIEMAFRDFN
jgi:ABC-type branched-subunit amino acid transport system substrate-binding protein